MVRYRKILVVTVDSILHFISHVTNIKAKVRTRNIVLKALVATTADMD